ncbi:MAG: hypothetical protein ACI83O_000374 [Patescibacteria group bacterium]|jgi:hypothetical protein
MYTKKEKETPRNIYTILLVITLIITISSLNAATNDASSASYQIFSAHTGSAGQGQSTSTSFEGIRSTTTYQQPSQAGAESVSYFLNAGWFISVFNFGDAILHAVFFSNETAFNVSNVFNETQVAYGTNITYIAANCTGNIQNVTFSIINNEGIDYPLTSNITNRTFTYNDGDIYVLNLSYPIYDSGNWSLEVICTGQFQTKQSVNAWELAWGTIELNLVNPVAQRLVTFFQFFNFDISVNCVGGECGVINVTLDPETVCEEVTICEDVIINQTCETTLAESCGEITKEVTEEICETNEIETCEEEEKEVCEDFETCDEVCEDINGTQSCENLCETQEECKAEVIEICTTQNQTSCQTVTENKTIFSDNCTMVEEITCKDNIQEVCKIIAICEDFNETTNQTSNVTLPNITVPKTNTEEDIEEESTPDTPASAPSVTKVPITINVSNDTYSAKITFAQNVTIKNKQLINQDEAKKFGIQESEFTQITPILAIELENQTSATIVLPKDQESQIDTIRKCNEWDFTTNACESGWFNYKTQNQFTQDDKDVIFTVTSFSAYVGGNYTAGETAQLIIWDDTDTDQPNTTGSKVVNETINFFANYQLSINLSQITTAACAINITDSNNSLQNYSNMVYNSTFGYQLFSTNFSNPGLYSFSVTCNSTYTNLTIEDSFVVEAISNSSKGGDISMDINATPFYTTTQNPYPSEYLFGGETQNISWSVNSTGVIGQAYTFFAYFNPITLPGIIAGNNSDNISIKITQNITDQSNPVILSTIITPDTIIEEGNISFSMTAEDDNQIQNCYTNISYPNGTFLTQLEDTCNTPQVFEINRTNGVLGNYTATFYVQDNFNKTIIINQTFTYLYYINVTIEINITASSIETDQTASIEVEYATNNTNIHNETFVNSTTITLVDDTYNIRFLTYNNSFIPYLISIPLINDTNETLKIDQINLTACNLPDYSIVYNINTSLSFTSATVGINYSGVSGLDQQGRGINMYVNHAWENDTTCLLTSWVLLPSVTDTAEKTVTGSVSHFSAFALEQGPFCGDLVCNATESTASCPTDCPATETPSSSGGGGSGFSVQSNTTEELECTQNSDCSSNNSILCISNTCVEQQRTSIPEQIGNIVKETIILPIAVNLAKIKLQGIYYLIISLFIVMTVIMVLVNKKMKMNAKNKVIKGRILKKDLSKAY